MAFAEKIIKLYKAKEIYNFDKFLEKVEKIKISYILFLPYLILKFLKDI